MGNCNELTAPASQYYFVTDSADNRESHFIGKQKLPETGARNLFYDIRLVTFTDRKIY